MAGEINFGILDPKLGASFATGYNEAEDRRNELLQRVNVNRLADLQYRAALRGENQAQAEEAAWKPGGSLEEIQNRLAAAGLGKQSLAVGAQNVKLQTDKLARLKAQTELMKDTATKIMADPATAEAHVKRFGILTGADVSADLKELQDLGGDPVKVANWAAGHALKAEHLLPKFETKDTGGELIRQAYNPLTGVPIGNSIVTPKTSAPQVFQRNLGGTADVVSVSGGATPRTTIVPGSTAGKTMTPGEKARLDQAEQHFTRRLEQETAAGELTPETRDFAANLVAQGGAMPSLGMGKAAAKMRSEILSRAAQIATEGGGSAAAGAADVLANKAGLTGRAAEERVLGSQGANVALASSEARKMIELAKGYSAAIDRTQYPSINAIQNAVNKGTGDKNIVALNTALNSLVNSYARAINPKGIATVSDKNHAREIVNANYANGQLDTIFNVMDEEMKAAQESTGAARASLRGKPAAVTTPKEVDFGDLRK